MGDEERMLEIKRAQMGQAADLIYSASKEILGPEDELSWERILRRFGSFQEGFRVDPHTVDEGKARRFVTIWRDSRDYLSMAYRSYRKGFRRFSLAYFYKCDEYVDKLDGTEARFVFARFRYQDGPPFFFCENCGKVVLARMVLYGLRGKRDVDSMGREISDGMLVLGGCVDRGASYQCPDCFATSKKDDGSHGRDGAPPCLEPRPQRLERPAKRISELCDLALGDIRASKASERLLSLTGDEDPEIRDFARWVSGMIDAPGSR